MIRYAKHLDSDDSIKNKVEYQFFECICVMAYEHVAEGSTVKNDIKWDSLLRIVFPGNLL